MEENKELDDFFRKSITEVGLENPSEDFTKMVMSKINVDAERSAVFTYKPLLSKPMWFVLVFMVGSIFAFVIFGQQENGATILWFSKLNDLTSFNLSLNRPELSLSTTSIYGFLGIAFFVWFQVFFIKQRFSKRYSIS